MRIFLALALAVTLAGCAAAREEPAPTQAPDGSFRKQQVDSRWNAITAQFPDAARPGAEVVREIEPNEWATTIADCVSQAGFPATPLPDGGVSYAEIPSEQLEARTIADFVCFVQYPVAEKYLKPFNEDQLRSLYTYWTTELPVCLETFELDVGVPPSEQVFLETYDTPSTWNPYAVALASVSEDTYNSVVVTCPQFPDTLWK
jgi:hypothetical protein